MVHNTVTRSCVTIIITKFDFWHIFFWFRLCWEINGWVATSKMRQMTTVFTTSWRQWLYFTNRDGHRLCIKVYKTLWYSILRNNLHQNFKNLIYVCMFQAIIEGLETRGHIVNRTTAAATVNSIQRGPYDRRVYAAADFRQLGGTDGFWSLNQ